MDNQVVVRIIRPWKSPDWLRQTPGGGGRCAGIQFTEDVVERPDFAIVCNHVERNTDLFIDPARLWLVLQEPPVRSYHWLRAGFGEYGRVFGPDPVLNGNDGLSFQHGMLPWHVGRTYDQLSHGSSFQKSVDLAWVTSNATHHRGHKSRMRFLDRLRETGVPLQLHGRGFAPIEDKWDALCPARYALAIENFTGPHYWTEKVADCFLAGALPLYWGCTNLQDYFPEDSFVWIDIEDRHCSLRVKEIVRSNLAETRRDAIAEARRRVLDEHQFFPFMSRLIKQQLVKAPDANPVHLTVHAIDPVVQYKMSTPFGTRVKNSLRRKLFAGTR
jgi:hypothetical protein